MLSLFSTYLELGFKHISDPTAYDHIVFIIALCAIYKLSEWKKVAILVTAFTIGHSITLALAAFKIITFPGEIIEILIPVTIILTCMYNVIFKKENIEEGGIFNRQLNVNYLFALFFGLIHGIVINSFGFKNAKWDHIRQISFFKIKYITERRGRKDAEFCLLI